MLVCIVSNVAVVTNVSIASKVSHPKIVPNTSIDFILRGISEDGITTYLVLFIPVDNENQAITYSMQTKVPAVYNV